MLPAMQAHLLPAHDAGTTTATHHPPTMPAHDASMTTATHSVADGCCLRTVHAQLLPAHNAGSAQEECFSAGLGRTSRPPKMYAHGKQPPPPPNSKLYFLQQIHYD